jgi:hypothetical protein
MGRAKTEREIRHPETGEGLIGFRAAMAQAQAIKETQRKGINHAKARAATHNQRSCAST